jgi:hypothetical protein
LNLDNNKYHIFKDVINLLQVDNLVVLNKILNSEANSSIIILNNNNNVNLLKSSSKKS